jgi:hypothetical protein
MAAGFRFLADCLNVNRKGEGGRENDRCPSKALSGPHLKVSF